MLGAGSRSSSFVQRNPNGHVNDAYAGWAELTQDAKPTRAKGHTVWHVGRGGRGRCGGHGGRGSRRSGTKDVLVMEGDFDRVGTLYIVWNIFLLIFVLVFYLYRYIPLFSQFTVIFRGRGYVLVYSLKALLYFLIRVLQSLLNNPTTCTTCKFLAFSFSFSFFVITVNLNHHNSNDFVSDFNGKRSSNADFLSIVLYGVLSGNAFVYQKRISLFCYSGSSSCS